MEKQLHFPDSRSGKSKQSHKPAFPKKTHAKRARNGQMAAPPVMRTDAEAWEIVSKNLGLIPLGLRKWGLGSFPIEYREDLRSIAVLSLFNSAKHWNEEEGKFSTYSIARMRECVREAYSLLDNVSLPPQVVSILLRYIGWKPKHPEGNTSQFAEYAGVSPESASRAIHMLPLFLGIKHVQGGHSILYGQSAREEEPAFSQPEARLSLVSQEIGSKMKKTAEDVLVKENARERLLGLIHCSGLGRAEKDVLAMRLYGKGERGGLTIEEIAKEKEVTSARIVQILRSAVRKLSKCKRSELREILDSFNEG